MSALERSKGRVGITALWQLRNWRGRPGRSCRVPYREDRAPSGSILPNDRLFHDFASGETFDAPGLLARVEELPAADACRLFIELAGGGNAPAMTPSNLRQHSIRAKRVKLELPPLDFPTPADLRDLARLRCVSVEACEAAAERRHLFCATWRGSRCWVITDHTRRAAQIRRLDGEPFRRRDGQAVKALTARGSCASWPIGAPEASGADYVLLCEGGGDFLAAYHFALIEETIGNAQPVALLGAGQRIAPEGLALFANKRVRIFPHLDGAGAGAALRWESQLREAHIEAHCYDLAGLNRDDDAPVKDLNDMTRISADDFEMNPELRALTCF